MTKNTDDLKGRAKEAVGDLTDNDKLRHEGKTDRAGAKVKDVAQNVADSVGNAVDSAKDHGKN
jgi:uncharacterized protein YjbJ (UPF0337 family)